MRPGRFALALSGGVLAGLLAVAGAGTVRAAPADAEADAAIPVMVLGTYHFANPGRDVHNAKIASMLTNAKQAELVALADRLATFEPTVVAVEQESDAPDLLDPRYARLTFAGRAKLQAENANEVVQIGYRVANRTGARVIAVDVGEKAGEPSYFPYDPVLAWAKAHPGDQARLDRANAAIAGSMKGLERDQARLTVTQILRGMNGDGPDGQRALHRAFYGAALTAGAGDAQPGAELNGRWYTRNAKIFAKIAQATGPGDRVLVVYGAGHSYWLRQLAATTPGFRDVAVAAYLAK